MYQTSMGLQCIHGSLWTYINKEHDHVMAEREWSVVVNTLCHVTQNSTEIVVLWKS